MDLKRCTATLIAVMLGSATTLAVAQEQDRGKDSIAGKAAAAKPAKAGKSTSAQPTAAAVKATTAPAMSKPAGAESALGHGRDAAKSHCHSSGNDA